MTTFLSRIKELKQSHLPEGSLKARFTVGTFWSVAGAVISRGLALLASIVVARFLGKTGFGELGIIQSTVGMFGTFAGLGLGITATRYVAEFRHKDTEKTGRIIGLSFFVSLGSGGLISILLIAFSPWLAERTLAAPHLTHLLQIGSGLLFFSVINGTQIGALSGFEAFRTITTINLVSGLLTFPLMIGAVYIAGLNGAVLALVLAMVFNCILNYIALKRYARRDRIPIDYVNSMKERHILWHFSLPALLSGMMVGPVNWVCGALLVNQQNGYAEMGIFNAANQWRSAILFLPGIFGQVLVPMLTERISLKDRRATRKILSYSMALNALILSPIVVVGCLLSPTIMSAYGKDFSSSWVTLIVLLITAGLQAVQTPVGQIIAATGKMWIGLIMNLGWAVVTVFVTILALRKGALGLAAGQMCGYIVHGLWTFAYAYKVINAEK
jgi:O-antigen/teichoic acid export membrane protein